MKGKILSAKQVKLLNLFCLYFSNLNCCPALFKTLVCDYDDCFFGEDDMYFLFSKLNTVLGVYFHKHFYPFNTQHWR